MATCPGANRPRSAICPWVGAGLCAADTRQEIEGFFEKRSASVEGGPRVLAQVLEVVDQSVDTGTVHRDLRPARAELAPDARVESRIACLARKAEGDWMIGSTLSHYRVLEKLGAGGMGEVYRAEDTRLKRQVALKVLPEGMARDPERLRRFQREAEAIASLSHPGIVTIFSVEEAEGVHFLTMELVSGRRLDEVVPPGGMALDDFLEVAVPLVAALVAAHDRGITHRDLKPANVMVTDDGVVKVLDFGLAKLRQPDSVSDEPELPTEVLTQEGLVLGTIPYMSPEQLEGRQVDHRSDVFSVGIVLHEMIAGERPFKGESSASLITSILRDRPGSVSRLRADVPPALERVILRCLQKDPERRFQTAKDLRNELEELPTAPEEAAASRARSIAVLPFADMSPQKDQD